MSDITRAVVIGRCLRNLDESAEATLGGKIMRESAIELELGRAFDAGHIAGSGVRHQTDAEQHLAEVVRELSNSQLQILGSCISLDLLDAIEKVRSTGDVEETEAENFDVGHL